MRKYRIYNHPNNKLDDEHEVIQVGFSWLAFIFRDLWLLSQSLWLHFIFFLMLGIGSIYLSGIIREKFIFIIYIISFIIALVLGFLGNGWKESNIKRKGYFLVKEVKAKNSNLALKKVVGSGFGSGLNDLLLESVKNENKEEIIKFLKKGADPKEKGNKGYSAIEYAISASLKDIENILNSKNN
jgi:hypothetical protein